MAGRARAGLIAAAALALTAGAVAVSDGDSGPPPLAGAALYREPESRAGDQARAWAATRPADARAMLRIARQPHASWFGSWVDAPRRRVAQLVARAARARAVPVVVVYNLPERDCRPSTTPAAYRRFVLELARGIRSGRAAVILEPDALPGLDCLSRRDRRTRIALMRAAVRRLGALPRVRLYVDAGHANWRRAATMARRLRSLGPGVDGFSLNVANFGWTGRQVAYGRRIATAFGGRGFVVDTSRNGRGPLRGRHCNPPGRGLGLPPTTRTGRDGVDALLWVKGPGFSDGRCGGGPRGGAWWPEYALGLARRARVR